MRSANKREPAGNGACVRGEWWRGAVIYQIYPRSFMDTNGDGVGDLPGIVHKLDYVADLGVDAIWLSPFFTSPMRDFGYDVSDYRNVDDIFGTLVDFDALIEKAHRLGLKIIIDQVYSHTSDAHAWFQESRQSRNNPRADWFVWADPQPDGAPPNNWQAVFGGPAWEWDSRRQQYYLHNFLPSQPDLNLHNEEVQNALLDVARFWLDRGVDGFRLDAINFGMHDPQLRDNPPATPDGRLLTRPFDYQSHIHNMSHPDIPQFLERLRQVTDEYEEIFTVAEVVGPYPLPEMKAFTAENRRLNSAYSFAFLYADKLTAELVKNAVGAWRPSDGEGWPAWAFSNHDAPRAVSRWASPETRLRAAKCHAMILMSLRGNAFIYQGEELGLPQAEIPFELLQDPEAIANWPMTLGRDGARTPLPWNSACDHGEFTTGAPWLPVSDAHRASAVDRQQGDQSSVLAFFREMIKTRKNSEALKTGDSAFIDQTDGLLAFYRRTAQEEALCVFNISETAQSWRPLGADQFTMAISIGLDSDDGEWPGTLAPLSGYIAIRSL